RISNLTSKSLSSLAVPFSFNDPPPTAIYTLSLHDALPILTFNPVSDHATQVSLQLDAEPRSVSEKIGDALGALDRQVKTDLEKLDRKSTRLNPVTVRSRMPSSA